MPPCVGSTESRPAQTRSDRRSARAAPPRPLPRWRRAAPPRALVRQRSLRAVFAALRASSPAPARNALGPAIREKSAISLLAQARAPQGRPRSAKAPGAPLLDRALPAPVPPVRGRTPLLEDRAIPPPAPPQSAQEARRPGFPPCEDTARRAP